MNTLFPYLFFIGILIFGGIYGCSYEKSKPGTPYAADEIWFKQANLDLGYRIDMINDTLGLAISRGKGTDVKGEALIFTNGKWNVIDEYEYSDFPAVIRYNNDSFWYLIHETHNGFYKPHLYSHSLKYDSSSISRKEIELPPVMWDRTDFLMWQSISVLPGGTAYMAGQLGHIVYYNGSGWKEIYSPLLNSDSASQTINDLNDIQMLSDTSGWAVARNGSILKFTGNKWEVYAEPVKTQLKSISMVDENFGWAVGDNGTILNYNNGSWSRIETAFRMGLSSVKAVSRDKAWIVGSRSTFLEYEKGEWKQNISITIFDDYFEDIDVIKDEDNKYNIWVIGTKGIYTNTQDLKFSFTDITSQAALRKEGRAGFFFDHNNDSYPELLVLSEDGSNIFYENEKGISFREVKRNEDEAAASFNQSIAIGDINNDGYEDILELTDDVNYKLEFGKSDFEFSEKSTIDLLKLSNIQNDLPVVTAKFIDFDNDGNLDLYVSNYNSADMLFRNDGTGKFQNVYEKSGIEKLLNHSSYGATFSDFNTDGLIDIVITYRVAEAGKHIYLFLNKGDFTFQQKDDSTFYVSVSPATFSSAAEDFNNDGFTDLFIFNNNFQSKLLLNDGKASFTNVSVNAGLGEPILHPEPINGIVAAADVNNDGWTDLFIGSKLFLNSPGLVFRDVTEQVGIEMTGNPSFADIDNDGDMDLFIGSSKYSLGEGIRAVLYRNNHIGGNYIKVKLNPDESSRSGTGTKVILTARDKRGEVVYISQKQAGIGSSPMVQNDLSSVHFGINPEYKYTLKAIYPSGKTNVIENPEFDKTFILNESGFLNHFLILSGKSFGRTLLLINWQIEAVKIIVFLSLLVPVIRYGFKTKAKGVIKSWYFIPALVMMFVVLVHLNIENPVIVSALYSVLLPAFSGIIVIYFSAKYLERKESRYISHFKLLEVLGTGGMGKVYKASDIHTNKIAAVKVLNEELLKDPENKKRFSMEGQILSSFVHPNIVKVYESGETDGKGFIVMEYLPGGTLKEHLEKNHPLSIREIKSTALQICEGLIEIHNKNIVHRDLKTGNIMLDEEGNIRIMDFGLSKSNLVSTMTSLGTVLGTLGYVAPEQVTGVQVDKRTDIFSLGVILYELLTNRLPFSGENEIALIHSIFNTVPPMPSEVRSDVTETMNSIVMKCLSKDIDQRYSSADAVKAELLEV